MIIEFHIAINIIKNNTQNVIHIIQIEVQIGKNYYTNYSIYY